MTDAPLPLALERSGLWSVDMLSSSSILGCQIYEGEGRIEMRVALHCIMPRNGMKQNGIFKFYQMDLYCTRRHIEYFQDSVLL